VEEGGLGEIVVTGGVEGFGVHGFLENSDGFKIFDVIKMIEST
jgi:hypothetical protein